jgi:hypothetical protein
LLLDRVAAVLDEAVPPIDTANLSHHVFVTLQPELQRRAAVLGWRRVALGILAALLPLPLVLACNAYFLREVYELLSNLLPATVVAYLVFSYAAFFLLLFASTYAAIPLLVMHRRTHARTV